MRLRHTPQPDGTTQTDTLRSITWDYEPGTWRPLSQTETLHHANGETQRNTYAILSDHLGTPKELLDQEGEVAWAADSDLWGDTTVLAEAKTDCPLRFQGQYFDEESRLAYNCQRYYDPATGRYLSNDPLGLAGGPSPHAYVHNPLTWVDPLGLVGNPATATHITYVGTDARTAKPYVGYASMQGQQTGETVLKYRYGSDFTRFGGTAPEVIYEGHGQSGKATARGLEQRTFEDYGGLNGTANRQNPVGENNPRKNEYLEAADRHRASSSGCCK